MIKSIAITSEVITILTSKKEIEVPNNVIKSMYISKKSYFFLNLLLTFFISLLFFAINYYFLNNTIILNGLLFVLLFLVLKEFVFKEKTKYYLILETKEDTALRFKFKNELKYDVFYIKDQVYVYQQIAMESY
jgi:hypothetical protein